VSNGFRGSQAERLYLICSKGAIAVVDEPALADLSRLRTRSGARTGLFIPRLDRLLAAAPAENGAPAELRVYQPR
jgi:hypothetical protein